ncbi:TIGR02453 family protein [Bacteroidia bacterium]|nr:TIGR02453 family protein [Bacteroidia bacterium]
MKNIISFLSELKQNNHKEWFDANRERYNAIKKDYYQFVDKMIAGIAKFDSSVAGLRAKDVVFRINRDIRFSHDKSPYKTNFGAYVCPKGKKSGFGGYYLHIEATQCMFATGVHMTDPSYLNSIREDIIAEGEKFESAIKSAKGFVLDEEDKLKTVPKNFPKDSQYAEYLKLKNICLVKFFDPKDVSSDDFLEKCVNEFKKTVPFNQFLNRAIEFLMSDS